LYGQSRKEERTGLREGITRNNIAWSGEKKIVGMKAIGGGQKRLCVGEGNGVEMVKGSKEGIWDGVKSLYYRLWVEEGRRGVGIEERRTYAMRGRGGVAADMSERKGDTPGPGGRSTARDQGGLK